VRGAPGGSVEIRFVVDSLPHERIPGVSVEYGAIRSERGHLVRTVVTRPARSGVRRLPGVVFIPWLSCDAVEKPEPGTDGFALMLRDIAANAGAMLLRVEKLGGR
jgi:hypothetical protein